ncbi:MAG: glutaminase [Polaromonas sp.]
MESAVVHLIRELTGNHAIDYDRAVAASELAVAHRNMAAAYLMKSFGNFANPMDTVLKASPPT